MYFWISRNKEYVDIVIVTETFKFLKGGAQPLLMYFLPGLLYYRACVYF
jgi:hypothetical protein